VSINDATTIEVLTFPASIIAIWSIGHGNTGLTPPLALCGLIKEFQFLFDTKSTGVSLITTYGCYSNRVAGGNPLQFISGPDSVLIGDGFWNRQLQLTRNFWHILTIARMISLFHQNLRAGSSEPKVNCFRQSRLEWMSAVAPGSRAAETKSFHRHRRLRSPDRYRGQAGVVTTAHQAETPQPSVPAR
jgi:hypothetical protein